MPEPESAWLPDDQHGYSIALCRCEDGPYLGARRMGSPCCCERCGFMTQDQFDFLIDSLAQQMHKAASEVVAGVRAWCSINEIAEPPLDWEGLGEFLNRVNRPGKGGV